MTTVGGLGGPGMSGDAGGRVSKPDPLWECGDWGGGATLRPLSLSSGHLDNNDMWDFSGIGTSGYAFEPQDDSTHVDEGFWEIKSTGTPNLITYVFYFLL